MGVVASQITSLTIIYSTVDSDTNQISKLRVTGLCAGNSPGTGGFPAQMASNADKMFLFDDVIMMNVSLSLMSHPKCSGMITTM